jgi:hypothetical protein
MHLPTALALRQFMPSEARVRNYRNETCSNCAPFSETVLVCRPRRTESPQDNFMKTFGEAGMKSLVVKRSVMIDRHKTSVT